MPQPRTDAVETFERARHLIDDDEVADAADLYAELLGDPQCEPDFRSKTQINMAAALCILARRNPSIDAASHQLERAARLLSAALKHHHRDTQPRSWGLARANLAIVHLSRFERRGDADDLFSAHLALDGAADAFQELGDQSALDWVIAIRDHLVALHTDRAQTR